ncbi:hypothetical protein MLD38_017578 [Melastoma candidum]|uniref:Uncharacterized protein n=1 Tax=Melastoma candidum TaxID=119954 RepID=A0ACB9QQ89_9MYRT|nr:hypothetical protein MLD38_017578 [Melastoma candidum]
MVGRHQDHKLGGSAVTVEDENVEIGLWMDGMIIYLGRGKLWEVESVWRTSRVRAPFLLSPAVGWRGEQPPRNPNEPQTEEERELEHECFAQYWSDKLAEEVAVQDLDNSDPDNPEQPHDSDSDSSVKEFDPKFFARFRARHKQVQDEAMESSPIISSESDSSDSDMEVIDSNTYYTLYKNGTYIAHKEEGILPGVAEQVGVRYRLEWRHTYASVWVRRKPEWMCFPKPGYPEGRKEGVVSTSRDLVLKPPSLKRKIGDWFVHRENKRRRVEKAERRARFRRVVVVVDKGVQTEDQSLEVEVNAEEKEGMADKGVQTDIVSPQELSQAQEMDTELGEEDVALEEEIVAKPPVLDTRSTDHSQIDGGAKERTVADDGQIPQDGARQEKANDIVIILGWIEKGQGQEDTAELNTEGRDEEVTAQVQDCQDSPGHVQDNQANKRGEMEAHNVIILGWKDGDQLQEGNTEPRAEGRKDEGNSQQPAYQASPRHVSCFEVGTQTDVYPEQVTSNDESLKLQEFVTRVVDGFEGLDEEQKLIQCQAMKFIVENVGNPSEEFPRLLDLMIAHIRNGVHKKFISLYGIGQGGYKFQAGVPGVPTEGFGCGSGKDEHTLTEAQVASTNESLHQFFEEHYGRLGAREPPRTVPAFPVPCVPNVAPQTMAVTGLDVVAESNMPSAAPLEEHCGKSKADNSVRSEPAIVPEFEPWVATVVLDSVPIEPATAPIPNPDSGPDATPSVIPEVVPVPDAVLNEPAGSTLPPRPDSRMNSTIRLLYDAIADSRNRPQALDQLAIRLAMGQLRDIQGESQICPLSTGHNKSMT